MTCDSKINLYKVVTYSCTARVQELLHYLIICDIFLINIIHSQLKGANTYIIKRLLYFSTAFQIKRTFNQRVVIRVIWYLRDGLLVLCASIGFTIN